MDIWLPGLCNDLKTTQYMFGANVNVSIVTPACSQHVPSLMGWSECSQHHWSHLSNWMHYMNTSDDIIGTATIQNRAPMTISPDPWPPHLGPPEFIELIVWSRHSAPLQPLVLIHGPPTRAPVTISPNLWHPHPGPPMTIGLELWLPYLAPLKNIEHTLWLPYSGPPRPSVPIHGPPLALGPGPPHDHRSRPCSGPLKNIGHTSSCCGHPTRAPPRPWSSLCGHPAQAPRDHWSQSIGQPPRALVTSSGPHHGHPTRAHSTPSDLLHAHHVWAHTTRSAQP
jgi:hypothetical protein